MCFSLVAFEWRTPYDIDKGGCYFSEPTVIIDTDEIPIVIEKDEQKEEIPKPEPPKHPTIDIKVVDDNTVIKEDITTEPEAKPNPFEGLTGPVLAIGKEPKEEPEEPSGPLDFVQIKPKFKCIKDEIEATNELLSYVQGKIKYPWRAQEVGVTGKVHARFVVDKEGKVTNIEIVRGLGYGCDEEVVRVLKSLPDFCPGFHNGKYRDTYFTLPVHFKM